MGLVSALYTGVSGLSDNASALNVIGDNIANVNTVGFKGGKTVFGDVLSSILQNGATTLQVGRGSFMQGVIQSFSQGSFEATSNATDMAISGAGFFVVNNGLGNVYTRAGQFRMNNAGLLANPSGLILQGFSIANGVTSPNLTNINLAGVQSSPKASTSITLGTNLNGAASAGTTFSSPITIYNSVGTQVVLNMNFTKQVGGNTWKYVAQPSTGTVTAGASGTLSFDTSGNLTALNAGPLANPNISISYAAGKPPAAPQTISWQLIDPLSGLSNGKMTGFSAPSNNNSFVADGFTTGTLIGLSVDTKGIISGLFNNGQSQQLFQVAMANFLSPTGLTKQGGGAFAASTASGQPIIGTATTGGFGSILGSSLELSNVDLSAEFVTMIATQQAYQASSKIITSSNDLLTTTINMVR